MNYTRKQIAKAIFYHLLTVQAFMLIVYAGMFLLSPVWALLTFVGVWFYPLLSYLFTRKSFEDKIIKETVEQFNIK